jgi:nucleoside-diphosphate-sugar epimerase
LVTVLDQSSADWSRLPPEVQHIKADILMKDELVGTCDDVEILYHLAARTDLDGASQDEYRVNFDGTRNLIEESAKARRLSRFVFYSTQLVTGLFDETRFIDETEPYRTKTPYGESKIEGEMVVKELCLKAEIPYTILRPTSVYGPWGESPYKEFFETIRKGRYWHVGKADNLVSLLYVKNLTSLTILASLSDEAVGQIYFCNDFHPYTMREVADTVAAYYGAKVRTMPSSLMTVGAYVFGVFKLLGVDVPIYPFRLKNIKANYCYDIRRSLQLGYDPPYDLVSGVKETLDWYGGAIDGGHSRP